MSAHRLKDFVSKTDVKFGHFIVEFATPGIGHILKSAGCEYVLFDLEHSGFSFETVKSAMRYFEAADLPAIVRVPSKEYHHIARVLDVGAEGIMVPMVGSAAEARHIVSSMKYGPQGGRGVALQVAHDRYRPGAVTAKLADANHRSTLFCQIETAEGVENADAIAAVEGVDCLWVGHFDLSSSLGVPGQFRSRSFLMPSTAWSARRASMARPWAGWCPMLRPVPTTIGGDFRSSATRATSGCCTMRSQLRSAGCAKCARAGRSKHD